MSSNNSTKLDDLPESMLEDAAIWNARLREPALTQETKSEFETWLSADPRHQQAYTEAQALWRALAEPVAKVLLEDGVQAQAVPAPIDIRVSHSSTKQKGFSKTPSRFRAVAIAASLVLIIGAGLIWQGDLSIRLQSDYLTGVGERAPYTLAEGSLITLNTDSAIAVDMGAERRSVRLLKGEAWFDVSADDPRPFFVETTQGTVRVTGTSFGVRLQDASSVINLTEGQVELRSLASQAASSLEVDGQQVVKLVPGQSATLNETGISASAPFDETVATAWLRGQFVFYDTSLAEVVEALNRHRKGNIVVLNSELNQLKVNGIFNTGDTDAALSIIEDTLQVKVTRISDYLVLLR